MTYNNDDEYTQERTNTTCPICGAVMARRIYNDRTVTVCTNKYCPSNINDLYAQDKPPIPPAANETKQSASSGPKPPELDLSNLWAEDEHEVKRKQEQYARDMAAYVKAQILSDITPQKLGVAARLKKFFSKKSVRIIAALLAAAAICLATGFASYYAGRESGYDEYKKLYNYEHDPSRQVWVTNDGNKYHYENCPTLINSSSKHIEMLQYALKDGCQPCSVCHEGRR